ncbi:MAG: hypothetical protein V8R27_03595 [Oscillospiraceae bacterium]
MKTCGRLMPTLRGLAISAKLPQLEEPWSFRLRSLMELRMLVLALYFEQDNQRVCRCDYCWGYFIPK